MFLIMNAVIEWSATTLKKVYDNNNDFKYNDNANN